MPHTNLCSCSLDCVCPPICLDGKPEAEEEHCFDCDQFSFHPPVVCKMDQARDLRQKLGEPGVLLLPGVYDCLSAKICEKLGFDCIYTSGFSIAGAALGMPDIGLLTASENIEIIGKIASSVSIPVIADCDTGYGGPANVYRLVKDLVKQNVAGICLEDQEWPKKCGHFEGKKVIPTADHCAKIRAAVDARGDSGMVIIGRTDSRAVLGIEEAILRAKAFYEAGADVVFVEATQSLDEVKRVSREMRQVPLLSNFIEGGKTPALSADELFKIGGNFKFLMFSTSGVLASTMALSKVYGHIAKNGTTSGITEHLESFANFKDLIGLKEYDERDEKYTKKKVPQLALMEHIKMHQTGAKAL